MDLSKPQKFYTCRGQTLFPPKDLRGDTVKSYQNVRSVRGCMQYLTRWAATALPNTRLGQTGVTNAASSQIKNSRLTPCSLPRSKKIDIRK